MGTSAHSNGPSQPDVEATLLKRRNEKREKKYASTVASIERAQRKLDKADKTVGRMVRLIAKLERQRRRLANFIALMYADQVAAVDESTVATERKAKTKAEEEKLGAAPRVELTESAKRIAKAKKRAEGPSDVPMLSAILPAIGKPKRKRRDADDFRKDMAAKTK